MIHDGRAQLLFRPESDMSKHSRIIDRTNMALKSNVSWQKGIVNTNLNIHEVFNALALRPK